MARHGRRPARRPADRHLQGDETYIRSQPHPLEGSWGIVEEYVGHGIGTEMHQDPQVHNYVGPRMGKGPELVEGLALAVEPMVNLGSRMTRVLEDNWTVVTADGSRSAHFEHSLTITERAHGSSPRSTAAANASRPSQALPQRSSPSGPCLRASPLAPAGLLGLACGFALGAGRPPGPRLRLRPSTPLTTREMAPASPCLALPGGGLPVREGLSVAGYC